MRWPSTLAGERELLLPDHHGTGERRAARDEIWFGLDGDTLYMLSGGRDRSDWVRNLIREPEVRVRLGDRVLEGRARIVSEGDEDARARELLLEKYSPGYSGDLSGWGQTALPVAVDLR